MTNVVLFTPKDGLDAAENLLGFISMCREDLKVFGADLAFEDDVWDITKALQLKGRGNARVRCTFSTLKTACSKKPEMMSDIFRPFAKAYIRYVHGLRPTQGLAIRLSALRALEAALSEGGALPDPTTVDGDVLNRAAQLLRKQFVPSRAYQVGTYLQELAEFMTKNALARVSMDWRNPNKNSRVGRTRVGKEFDELRAERLPSRSVLEALPKAFRLAVEPSDVIVTSIAAILCSAPDRVHEVLLLPRECEVLIKSQKKGGVDTYGLRWWPGKGAEPMVKLIIPSMASVVKEALSNIRRCTDEARIVAKWYEDHPEKIYLPNHLKHLRRQEFIDSSELGKVLWTTEDHSKGRVSQWCRLNSVQTRKISGHRMSVRFVDIEQVILAMLPADFPWLNKKLGLKYSDALMVMRRNELHATSDTYRCVIEGIAVSHIYSRLGCRSKYGVKSVFDRLGLTADDGSAISVATHAFRHYLNTLAQAGGMSQLDIAKWSGRKDINQNAVYDHVTADQMVAKIRNSIGDGQGVFGPLAEMPKFIPIRRDEFARLKIPTAHTTDFGFCVHDFTMSPCQLHRDCINCQEQVCIKGDVDKMGRVRISLVEGLRLLSAAKEAMQNGYAGAEKWMEHQTITVERLRQLCQLFDDQSILDGTIIQLSSIEMPSYLLDAARDRTALTKKMELQKCATPDMQRLQNAMTNGEVIRDEEV